MTEWIDQLKEKIIHLEVSTAYIYKICNLFPKLGGKSSKERTNRGVHSSEQLSE